MTHEGLCTRCSATQYCLEHEPTPETRPPTRREHELKTWPEFFQAVKRGEKRHEVRDNDRDYRVGDVLLLREYEPLTGNYTGDELRVRVTWLGTAFLPSPLVAMSIERDAADLLRDEGEPQKDDLSKAARSLMREVRGMFACWQNDIRAVIGCTNERVLLHWANEIEKALGASPRSPVTPTPEEGKQP